ncbi:hypothetical protein APHAL10511_007080 [Amanita phalloides]|nr:hypothetical protein APHAL10511_007080 [Amanita phalloides]
MESRLFASSNWLAMRKSSVCGLRSASLHIRSSSPRNRRRISHPVSKSSQESVSDATLPKFSENNADVVVQRSPENDSLDVLRRMVLGQSQLTFDQRQSGKYLALDCEMVGIGLNGSESSLARVTLVNYHGVVELDEYVIQLEKVVDYRTRYSGIRDVDMIKAKPFDEVQKRVAELLKDRTIIGHAIHNDLKALLLSHPRTHIRDTQVLAGKFKIVRSKYVALRNLVKQELGLTIQSGEHSSVTDARAAMAIYRLHRNNWEKRLVRVAMGNKDGGGRSHEYMRGPLGKSGRQKGTKPSNSDVITDEVGDLASSNRDNRWWVDL